MCASALANNKSRKTYRHDLKEDGDKDRDHCTVTPDPNDDADFYYGGGAFAGADLLDPLANFRVLKEMILYTISYLVYIFNELSRHI